MEWLYISTLRRYILGYTQRFSSAESDGDKRKANKWPQKCDGGPYNGADSVHWPFIYIYMKELPIYKKESGCIPPCFGDTLLDSWFDFENLTQSEAREPPPSGHKSVMTRALQWC